jgi:hypothetical protein
MTNAKNATRTNKASRYTANDTLLSSVMFFSGLEDEWSVLDHPKGGRRVRFMHQAAVRIGNMRFSCCDR